MTVSAEDVQKFAALFAGLTRAKGRYMCIHDPNKPQAAGDKSKGRATTLSEAVTVQDYGQHMDGQLGLGIVPVRDNGTCVFGAIDIDQYSDLDHKALAQTLVAHNIPAYICKSKSGGAHCYVFVKEPGILAPVFISYLKALRTRLGVDYRKAREIFPKQRAQSGGIGNWINLPYFGESRPCVTADGRELTLAEFLATVQPVPPQDLASQELGSGLVLTELPPCLERLMTEGIPAGMRNEAVFNFGVFTAKRFQTEHEKSRKVLKMINEKVCQPPIDQRELKVITDSILSHEYNYKCDQSPIVDVCDKARCALRPYGPQASVRPSDIPEIERIEIHGNSDGETEYHVKLKTHLEMIRMPQVIDYRQFKKTVCDVAHVYLLDVPQKKWDTYLASRWAVLAETVRAPVERSKRGHLLQATDQWIQEQVRHPEWQKPDNLYVGFPYCDGDFVYIKINDLTLHLRRISNRLEHSQVAALLDDTGWEKIDKQFGEHLFEGIWCRPQNVPMKEITHVSAPTEPSENSAFNPSGPPRFTPETADWADFPPSGGADGPPV